MQAIVSNKVQLLDVPTGAAREIRSRLTLRNPVYEQRLKAKASVDDTPQTVPYYADISDSEILIPRGALEIAKAAAARAGIKLALVDRTRMLEPVDLQFKGELRLYQLAAAAAVSRRWSGVIEAPTGSGKTVIGLYKIAERKQPALVIVPTEKLLEQWIREAREFLQLRVADIGLIGGGKKIIGNILTVGIINSVEIVVDEIRELFGHLIVDECHRVPGSRYFSTISAFDARYILGLSATPFRRDGLTPVINWLLGSTTKIDRAPLVASGAILPAEIEQRLTGFTTELDASDYYQEVIEEVIANPERNKMIAADMAAAELAAVGVTLILSDRKAHCGLIMAYLAAHGVSCARMQGGMSKKQKAYYQEKLERRELSTIVATTQYIGEGWDFPRVENLALATPIKFSGKLIQAIGRALRPAAGMDRAKITDYVDHLVPVLMQSGRARNKTYQQEVTQCS